MHANLISHISKYIELDECSIEVINKYFKPTDYKKKEFLLQEGQVCKSLHFVEKGCLRMYFINNKTTEQITQFAMENWWITDFFSFLDKKPSPYFIQTVENSHILSIDSVSYDAMLQELPLMERYFRIIMQRTVAASQLRVKYMYELSKEEFYLHFCNSFPQFIQRVPQYMIASYLGLTPEYVSELRKKNLS
ncbi:MAG: Crp/Fnr family transcriptional regulator [Bacteroidales bacterium]|nr:Crp/Fnr family transcriptional regulator [Bacteroidales bacterium]